MATTTLAGDDTGGSGWTAIDEIVFGQKVTEMYYKEFKRDEINFFGVLKKIGKFQNQRSSVFNIRREFFEVEKGKIFSFFFFGFYLEFWEYMVIEVIYRFLFGFFGWKRGVLYGDVWG